MTKKTSNPDETEAKAKAEAEAKAQAEAEAKAQAEVEAKVQAEVEAKVQAEAEAKSQSKFTGKETARITSVVQVGGESYQPNQLVKNIPAKELEELVSINRASIKKADVDYCAKELNSEVIDHTAKSSEKEAE